MFYHFSQHVLSEASNTNSLNHITYKHAHTCFVDK